MSRWARSISASNIGKGRNELTIKERQKLQKLIGILLDLFGYEKCT
jgi:hypothetical protein